MNSVAIPLADWHAAYLAITGLLARRRKELGISQEALAERLGKGVGRRTLQRWEHGEVDVPAARLFQWAAELGVKIAPDVAHERLSPETVTAARALVFGKMPTCPVCGAACCDGAADQGANCWRRA